MGIHNHEAEGFPSFGADQAPLSLFKDQSAILMVVTA